MGTVFYGRYSWKSLKRHRLQAHIKPCGVWGEGWKIDIYLRSKPVATREWGREMRPDEVVIFTVMIRDFEGWGEVQLQRDEICDKAPEITISITVRNDSPAGVTWIEFGRFAASSNLLTFYLSM
uniref:(northern house mosquito) hypothetical protein n=1 Tax=Culex pipiens TaxID=7175 RepID=A0A8D8JSY7_CULPI